MWAQVFAERTGVLGFREGSGMVASSARVSCLAAATLFFWSTFPTPAPAQTVSFIARRDFAVGVSPEALAVGDLNGDGVLDLAVVGPAGPRIGGVSVMLGQGDGTFPMAGNFFAFCGRLPSSVAVADFNRDGAPDLVVADDGGYTCSQGSCRRNPGGVTMLLGNGDGSFQAAKGLTAGGNPSSVVVGDFNGDGVPDLAVANTGSNNVSVLLGNGDGSFRAARTFSAGTNPRSVAVGDFNGDGVPDLAVANTGSNNVSVLLGNGDGSFQAAESFPVATGPSSVVVGDFNGDGKLDLAVTTEAGSPAPPLPTDTVSVLLGNGDGTFQEARDSAVSTVGPSSVAVGDFNGDGVPDLAVVGANGVSVLLGHGDGTFETGLAFAAPGVSVVVGDIDGDGVPDLAVAGVQGVSVLVGHGDGTFQAARNFAASDGRVPYSVAVGDFNGDGVLDLAVASAAPTLITGTAPGTVSVLLGNGNGTFQAALNVALGMDPRFVAVGDFNGDGAPDLVVAEDGGYTCSQRSCVSNPGGVSVLLGNGDGTVQGAKSLAAGANPQSVAVGDFNRDGVPDLAVAGANDVSVLLGNGDGTFQGVKSLAAGPNPRSVAVGDFNGDGVLDLAVPYTDWGPGTSGVSVLLGNGDGTFQTPRTFAVADGPWSVAVGDFNGDRVADLAVATGNGISVLLGAGDGTFQAARNFGARGLVLAVGDFDGDGVPDLALAGVQGVEVLLGNGDGTFRAPRTFGVGASPSSVAAGDFNGDGKLDLATANYIGSDVSVLINDTP